MRAWLGIAALLLWGATAAIAQLTGFTPSTAARQRVVEAEMASGLDPARMEQHLRWLTARPHPAGSEGARLTAEYLAERLREYGFEVQTPRYTAYMPFPVSAEIELIEPVQETLPTTEGIVDGDPFTTDAHRHIGWNGYSPSGAATGHVVYAHHGSASDFRALVDAGVDPRGKIVLVRYYGTGTGRKVRNAERAGAAAVVLYADPEDDGHPFGEVYPEGNWRPPDAIMRRTLSDLPYDGDPLSPGFASLPGAERLDPSEVELPRIPVLPISARSAQRILEHLGGPVAPADWQGALPLTYRLGPGAAKVRLRVDNELRDGTLHNVVGWLRGSDAGATAGDDGRGESWVLFGNHHDAWIYGAGDPSSGTAALLDLARVLGEMARDGQRPRRTIALCFWDAEELVLGGSTEWVEEHAATLLEHALVYVNMDSAVFNTERPLSVAAHPLLHGAFRDAARAITDPRTRRTLHEVWTAGQNEFKHVPGVDGWGEFFDPTVALTEPWVFEVPYDDAAPFFQLLALPASDMYYGADYGMYHSLYENFHWMKTVVDPDFGYHRLMAELVGRVVLRFANADLPPFDWSSEARFWTLAFDDLERVHAGKVPDSAAFRAALERWRVAAAALDGALATLSRVDPRQVSALARRLQLLPRGFYRAEGHAENALQRNLWNGSPSDLDLEASGGSLPGLRFALDRGDTAAASREAKVYLRAIVTRARGLEEIAAELLASSR
ncbi:MAG TPA: M28 family peptidase [Thermoanaerobaculia bacterium]|nr:M28 family peptidase [Thermoanaerobaculia bacterium]